MALQRKIQAIRILYKRRYQKNEKKFKKHVLYGRFNEFLKKYDPKNYHRGMHKLSDAKKRKELKVIHDAIEQYDFYYRDMIINKMMED